MSRAGKKHQLRISTAQLRKAEQAVGGCEDCDLRADTPFYWVLDSTVGTVGADYTLPSSVACPVCSAPIRTNTLVRWS